MFKYFNIIKKILFVFSGIFYFCFCLSALFFVDLSDQLYFYLPKSFSDSLVNNHLIKAIFPNTPKALLIYNLIFSFLIIVPLFFIIILYLIKPALVMIPLIGLGGLNLKALKAFYLRNDCYID